MPDTKIPSKHSPSGIYITFHSGRTGFALAVEFIRYITSTDAITKCPLPSLNGPEQTVFQFGGKPIPIYPFCDITGLPSLVEESLELIALLGQWRQDHIDWMTALDHSIRTGESFAKATDPLACAFGGWHASYRPADHELRAIVAKFDAPHRRLHALANSLLKMADNLNMVDEAIDKLENEKRSTLRELLDLFDLARVRLETMVKSVVVILDVNTTLFAVELDSIGDIQEFPASSWMPEKQQGQERKPCFDGYFQSSSSDLYLRVNPFNLLAQHLELAE